MLAGEELTHRDASSLLSPLSATVFDAVTQTARRDAETARCGARLVARGTTVLPPQKADTLLRRRAATGAAALLARAPAGTSGAARSGVSDMATDIAALKRRQFGLPLLTSSP